MLHCDCGQTPALQQCCWGRTITFWSLSSRMCSSEEVLPPFWLFWPFWPWLPFSFAAAPSPAVGAGAC